ncbi:MAG TPA: hypothetical protein DER54_07490 [Odoribacter splanchnicus]|nr:hypothetical protein [Odoribacter splanchnicus]
MLKIKVLKYVRFVLWKVFMICRGNPDEKYVIGCVKNNIPILWLILIILYRLGMIVLWLNIDVFIILNIGYI